RGYCTISFALYALMAKFQGENAIPRFGVITLGAQTFNSPVEHRKACRRPGRQSRLTIAQRIYQHRRPHLGLKTRTTPSATIAAVQLPLACGSPNVSADVRSRTFAGAGMQTASTVR